jgi:hypothetical protein
MAAAWGHADVVRLLLEKGANPTVIDHEGMSPPNVARHGYSSNNVTAEQRSAVCKLFRSLGLDIGDT